MGFQLHSATIRALHLPATVRIYQHHSVTILILKPTFRAFQLLPGPISHIQQPSVSSTYLQVLRATTSDLKHLPGAFSSFQLLSGAISHIQQLSVSFIYLQDFSAAVRNYQPHRVTSSAFHLLSIHWLDISAPIGIHQCPPPTFRSFQQVSGPISRF